MQELAIGRILQIEIMNQSMQFYLKNLWRESIVVNYIPLELAGLHTRVFPDYPAW